MLEKFKKTFLTTQGRLNRLNYFMYGLILGLLSFVVSLVLQFLAVLITGSSESFLSRAIETTIYILWFIPYLTLSIRRLHDLDKKEWLVVLNLIPVVNFAFALYLLFMPGTPGRNQYGEKPL